MSENPIIVSSIEDDLYMTVEENDSGINRESMEVALLTIRFSDGHEKEYLHVLGNRKECLEKELQDMNAIRGREVE